MKISKKISISVLIIIVSIFSWFNININSVEAAATKTTVKKTTVVKKAVAKKPVVKKKVVATTKTSMKWTADGLKALGSPASFGYNYTLRNAIIKKIENYARKNKITVINAKVVNNMNV